MPCSPSFFSSLFEPSPRSVSRIFPVPKQNNQFSNLKLHNYRYLSNDCPNISVCLNDKSMLVWICILAEMRMQYYLLILLRLLNQDEFLTSIFRVHLLISFLAKIWTLPFILCTVAIMGIFKLSYIIIALQNIFKKLCK